MTQEEARHPVVWFEWWVPDTAAARAFYGELFGWTFTALESYDPDYWMVDIGRGSIGGAIVRARGPASRPEDDRGTVVYVQVPDLEAALERAKGLDATVDMGVTRIPSSGTRFAILRDPFGTRVGLFAE